MKLPPAAQLAVLAALPLAAAVFAVAGCSSPSEQGNTSGNYEVIHVEVDGRQIPCVIWDGLEAGAITCDWAAR